MSKGRQHLELVTKKLNMKIAELGETIQEVQKDIENMNDYMDYAKRFDIGTIYCFEENGDVKFWEVLP